jgi:hypothetical protein
MLYAAEPIAQCRMFSPPLPCRLIRELVESDLCRRLILSGRIQVDFAPWLNSRDQPGFGNRPSDRVGRFPDPSTPIAPLLRRATSGAYRSRGHPHRMAPPPVAAPSRAHARPREARKDQDQPIDIPQFRSQNAANSSEHPTPAGIPCEQGIFRDLTGNVGPPKGGSQSDCRPFPNIGAIPLQARHLRDPGCMFCFCTRQGSSSPRGASA